MSPTSSAPLPTADVLFGGDASFAVLAEYLKTLTKETDEKVYLTLPKTEEVAWYHLLTGLTDNFVKLFPTPHELPWGALHEKLELAELTLGLVQRATTHVGYAFTERDGLTQAILMRHMNFCAMMDLWIDEEIREDDRFAADEFYANTVKTSAQILRSLGGEGKMTNSASKSRQTLKAVLVDCIAVCNDIITLSPLSELPLYINVFVVPRIQDKTTYIPSQNTPEENFCIKLDTPSQLPLFITMILELCVYALTPSVAADWDFKSVLRDLSMLVRKTAPFLCTSAAVSTVRRTRALARFCALTAFGCTALNNLDGTFSLTWTSMMMFRLYMGPVPSWEVVDIALQAAFGANTIPLAQADIPSILTTIRTESWGEAGSHLRDLITAFMMNVVPRLNVEALQMIREMLDIEHRKTSYKSLMQAVGSRLEVLNNSDLMVIDEIQNETHPHSWRTLVRTTVQTIIQPEELQWMDDDESASDVQYINRALAAVERRFENNPLYNPAADARLSLAKALGKLPCVLVHNGTLPCSTAHNKPRISIIPAYMALETLLLEGPENEVTAAVRIATYDALVYSLRHCSQDMSDGRMEYIAGFVIRGMKDHRRDVRLSSGRCLEELFCLYETAGGEARQRIQSLFDSVNTLLKTANDQVRETVLVILGRVGRTSNSNSLGQCILCLLSQFPHSNPAVRTIANVQLLAVANYHKKTPHNLLSPHLNLIGPFLLSHIHDQPLLWTTACRFMSIRPHDFIVRTINHTLPVLFAEMQGKALDAIAEELGEKLSHLFMKHSYEVLAHVLRIQSPVQSAKALQFILDMLREATGDATSAIDIPNVIRACTLQLVVELVVVLGDENADEARGAMDALHKVARYMEPSANQRTINYISDVPSLLRTYMLGIIFNLNNMLQDVQIKRPLETKKKILRSLGPFIQQVGAPISDVAPQIMATLQTMLVNPELADATLQSWQTFLMTLETLDVAPHVGPTSASFVTFWTTFSLHGREIAKRCIDFIVLEKGEELGRALDEVVDLGSIPELSEAQERILNLRSAWSPQDKIRRILERATSHSLAVAERALKDFRAFILADDEAFVRGLASGDNFDPLVGHILSALYEAACRDGEGVESLHLLAFDCIGILGAVDPDRFELATGENRLIMLTNFADETESMSFALHLIKDVLVGAFRTASDILFQNSLAYAIQELLTFCNFTTALIIPGSTNAVQIKTRNRWNSLPKHVIETVSPLLGGRFVPAQERPLSTTLHPIYPSQSTYREWMQTWTGYLISRVAVHRAQSIFKVFSPIVNNKDVGVARHLLPYLVQSVLMSGREEDVHNIRLELLAVLEDQVISDSQSTADKRLYSAQTVFMLMDHLNNWVRAVRQDISNKKAADTRRTRSNFNSDAEEQLLKIDSVLTSIDHGLMAKAALQCKAYARSLMNYEQQIISMGIDKKSNVLSEHYERMHEIYACLDEPDGMEGISSLIISPSLEHQIRQHESTGRWTSAQSCWEVRLQQSPDNLDSHLGLLRCLRNLGHYDTLRTHVKGVLTRNPSWESQLVAFQVESEWMLGNWAEVQCLVNNSRTGAPSMILAQVLLAMRAGEPEAISNALSVARQVLGCPIIAVGPKGYRRSYEAVLDLHMVHELDIIHRAIAPVVAGSFDPTATASVFKQLSGRLSARLDSTLPTFRTREPILSMRRTAFNLSATSKGPSRKIVGSAWLASAKIARKAGHWQTAYSAVLQAQQCRIVYSFLESAKLMKASGEPLRALQELENSMRLLGILNDSEDVIDITDVPEAMDTAEDRKRREAKAQLLRARWMNDSDRFQVTRVLRAFTAAAESGVKWESGQFHLGKFQDDCFKSLSLADQLGRGTRMNLQTVRAFAKASRYGSKYIYQTIPRLLTLWLDLGDNPVVNTTEVYKRLNGEVFRALKTVPAWKWYTAFPQIVSRVGHGNDLVYNTLSQMMFSVIKEYPKQALWLFVSVVKSTKAQRSQRGREILDKLKSVSTNNVPKLIDANLQMTHELLALCDCPIHGEKKTLNMSRDFPRLYRLLPLDLIIPLQESLTASLPPPSSSADALHYPFPANPPTFQKFFEEIEIMRSLAKPRKITLQGSDGQIYTFLGKPKDDLRKDARLMDFNAIINKLLKSNSDSRRRQLRIRTYGVVTLNEECGFIQWVPNTIPVRPVLLKGYEARNTKPWTGEMSNIFDRIKLVSEPEAAKIFVTEVLSKFPPVFHEWFLETFPEPTAWLASRLAYGRTAAVMSIIGFILGLGDRHCENILLDVNTGDVVHVDFNCLFEKGKQLEVPERVPFRLTQNMVDGLGVSGVEGVFRRACEITMQILHDNKDSLMSVLDAFVHDPLVEWEDEKRKLDRAAQNRMAKGTVTLTTLAKNALHPIEKKLKCIYASSRERPEREISTTNLVQILIQEATDNANLAKMYPGWAPWH